MIKNLSKSFQQANNNYEIFKNINFKIEKGNSYAIVGSSGIGKSTLLHMLAGIEEPTSGSIIFNDQCLASLPIEKKIAILHKNIGIVFQQPLLVHELSVLENVMLKKIIDGTTETISKQHAHNLLNEVNLGDKANNPPSSLSGGQQQRIAILRALFNNPEFLLADEPTGNLDQATGSQIIDLLLHYHKQRNMGLIISTHDINIAQKMDYILTIQDKNILQRKNS